MWILKHCAKCCQNLLSSIDSHLQKIILYCSTIVFCTSFYDTFHFRLSSPRKTAKIFCTDLQNNILEKTQIFSFTFITVAFFYFALVMVKVHERAYALHYPADGYRLTKYCEKWPLIWIQSPSVVLWLWAIHFYRPAFSQITSSFSTLPFSSLLNIPFKILFSGFESTVWGKAG